MAIRVTCTQCTTTFRVDDDRVGKEISCPTCFKRIYVEPLTLGEGSTPPVAENQEYRLAPLEELPDRVDPLATVPRPSGPHKQSDLAAEAAVSPTIPAAPRGPVAESQDQIGAAPQPLDRKTHCPECNATLAPGSEHCHICFYHVGLGRVVNTLDEDDPVAGEYGFRRLLLQKLQKDQSPESVFFLLDILIVLAAILASVVNFRFALVVIPLALFYISYRAIVWTGGLSASGRSVLWRLVLFFGRALKWRTWGGTARVAATMRGEQFGDREMASLENLDTLQVLDFEGTGITDQGLATLKHRRHIIFLVVRKTRVTAEGVWELQQTIPQACIWY